MLMIRSQGGDGLMSTEEAVGRRYVRSTVPVEEASVSRVRSSHKDKQAEASSAAEQHGKPKPTSKRKTGPGQEEAPKPVSDRQAKRFVAKMTASGW